jgi:hypothetical protein
MDQNPIPGLSLTLQPWAEISERLRRYFKLNHYLVLVLVQFENTRIGSLENMYWFNLKIRVLVHLKICTGST